MSMLNITVCFHSPDIVFVGTDQIEEVPHNSLKISIKWLLQYYCINTSGSYYTELGPLTVKLSHFTQQIKFDKAAPRTSYPMIIMILIRNLYSSKILSKN